MNKKNWIYYGIAFLIFIAIPGGFIISAWMTKNKLKQADTDDKTNKYAGWESVELLSITTPPIASAENKGKYYFDSTKNALCVCFNPTSSYYAWADNLVDLKEDVIYIFNGTKYVWDGFDLINA